MLEVLLLGRHASVAPLVRIAGRPSMQFKDIAAVRLEETAEFLQRRIEVGVHVAVAVIEQAGAMGDELLDVAVQDGALPGDMVGDVVGDLQAGLAAPEVDDGIIQVETPLEQGIVIAPGPAPVLAQFLIGAEVAGLTQPLQDLIALAARAVLEMEALAAGPVGVEQIVGFQIRDIDKVVKTIKCGGQHGTTPTSQGGDGMPGKACSSQRLQGGEVLYKYNCGKGILFFEEPQGRIS